MKLSVRHWRKTLVSLGLKWATPTKKKRRKSANVSLEFGSLEPRKLLAHGHSPPPLPDPDPTPPPVIVSGPETTEEDESFVSDLIPDVHVGTIGLVDPGAIVDGDLAYADSVLTGSVEGDFTTYPRVKIEFDLEAVGAQLQGNLYSSDAYVIIEDPATDPTFQLDPNNPANVGAYNPFLANTPGWKEIGYRVIPIDANGDAIVDSEGLMLASPWESIGFKLIDPAEGPVRVVDVALIDDTDDSTDQQTQDPRVQVVVHGEFQASQSYRLEFEYQFDGQTQTDHIDVPQLGPFVYDPLVSNPDLAFETTAVDLTFRLMSSADAGATWNQVSTDLFSFTSLPILEATIGEIVEEQGETPYRGGDRVVTGWLADTVEDSTVPYLVDVEIGVPDGNGGVSFHADGEATVRFDEEDQRFEYSHVLIDSSTAVQTRARVKQWIRGEYKFSPWMDTTLQEPVPFDLASVSVEEEPEREGSDQRGPGLIPTIVGSLDGAPTVEALEDNSEAEDPLDYRELSNVRVEFYHSVTAPDENSIADGHVQTDSFGHFEYRPDSLNLGTNQIWVRSVLELDSGQKYLGPAQSVSIDVDPVELPTLLIELLDTDAVEHTDENTGEVHWSTADPRINGTLTTTDTSLHAYQVTVEYAQDAPNVAGDESEVVGRSYAGYEDKTSYYPLLAAHEGEIVKVRARVAYYHPQLGEEIYSDWTELSIQLESAVHEPSTISELEVLGSREQNASDEAIVRGDSAWIAGGVAQPEGSYAAVTVQFRDVATGAVLGQTTTSASGRFTYSLENLTTGAQQIEAVVLDWNYQTAAVEAGPATALTFEVQDVAPILVSEFELHSDTGAVGNDSITSNPTLVGRLSGDGRLGNLRVALTRNDGHEVIVSTDSSGRFIYRGDDLNSGSSYTYQARVATWDVVLADYTYGTPAASDVTFQYQTESGVRATIGLVGLADTSSENYDAATGVVHDLTIRGRIVSADQLGGVSVEIDFDGDGTVDDSVQTDRYGEFVFAAGALAAGSVTPQVRVSEVGYDATAWTVLPTFDYQPIAESLPEIATFSQSAVDSPRLTGSVSGDAANAVVDILVEHEGQNIVVAQVEVDEQGNFEYLVPNAQVGESIQFKARARSIASGRWVYGAVSIATFQYQPTTYVEQLTLKNDNVTGGTGTAVDGVTDDSAILIQVAGAAATVSLEVQRDGEEAQTVEVPVTNGVAEYTPSELGMGYHSLRVRVVGSEDAPWQQLNFVFDSDATRTESLVLAQELTDLDPNWTTANYESTTSENEDFDFQLSQAEESHDAAVAAANETLKQQRLFHKAIYDASMRAARQDFEANVPESLRRFELDPFTWPDNPLDKSLELSEQESPYVISYTGEGVDVSRDSQYIRDVQAAHKLFQTREKGYQDSLRANVDAAEATWKAALESLKTTRDADLATAHQQYQDNLQGIAQDVSGLESIQTTLKAAKVSYDAALRANGEQYDLTITQREAQYTAAMLQLQAEEEAELPPPPHAVFASVKPIIEEYGAKYKAIYIAYQEAKFDAELTRDKNNASALETYEKAQSKADADTAKLLHQLKHDRIVLEQDFRLTYKTEVAQIQRVYSEGVASVTDVYRRASGQEVRNYESRRNNAIKSRDDSISTANLDAVTRWADGLNTAWSNYQKELAQVQNDWQQNDNEQSRLFAQAVSIYRFKDLVAVSIASKETIIGQAAEGESPAVVGQAEMAENLAVQLATAARDMKVSASEARTQRDNELAEQWQDRRDSWSRADRNFAFDQGEAVKKYRLAEETTRAEFQIQLVHPSYYGRTWYYAAYRSTEFDTYSFPTAMQGSASAVTQIVDSLNAERIAHQTTYKTELAEAQKFSDSDRIDADQAWRKDSAKTYHDALTRESSSGSGATGWYSVRDTWNTAVQNAHGQFQEDFTAMQGALSVKIAKAQALTEHRKNTASRAWRNNTLTALVGQQSTSSPLVNSKWQQDIDALATFRTAVINEAFDTGKISQARKSRELARHDDLIASRQTYFEELADAYWTQRNARQSATDAYAFRTYGFLRAYVQRGIANAAAENAFAQNRLDANHQIALSAQEKLHDSQIAGELLEFHEARADEIARRSDRIVDAVYTKVVALIPVVEFAQYTGGVGYDTGTQFNGTHSLTGELVYINDSATRDAISDAAAEAFVKSVADANRDYEIDLADARKTLVSDLGTADLSNVQNVQSINNTHVGLWATKQNELTAAIGDAEVVFQTEESTRWATSAIDRAAANEVYGISEAEINRDRNVRDAAIELGYANDAIAESRDQIHSEHEAHIASLQADFDNAVAATIADASVANKEAEALAKFQLDVAKEEFEGWKNWRIERERYDAEVYQLSLARQTSIEDAIIQRLNDSRIYSNRMTQADGTLVQLPEEINREFEIERAQVLADRLEGRVEVFGELLFQRTMVQGQHDVDLMTLAVARDNEYANAEVGHVQTVATAVHQNQYGTIDEATLSTTRATAETDREAARQTALDNYEAAADNAKHASLVLLGQKRVTFVADYTQKQIDYVNSMNAAYALYDTGINEFEAAQVGQSNVAGTAYTLAVTQAQIDAATNSKQPAITHQTNLKNIRVASAEIYATAEADFHLANATIDLDEAIAALGTSTDEALLFAKDKAFAYKAWLVAMKANYVDYQKAAVESAGDLAIDLATASGTRAVDSATAQAVFDRDSQAASNQQAIDLDNAEATSAIQATANYNALDLAQANADKLLAEELIAAEVERDNALDAIGRDSSLTTEEKATQTQDVNDTFDEAVAQAKHDRIIRTAEDGSESGRAVAWNEFQNAETERYKTYDDAIADANYSLAIVVAGERWLLAKANADASADLKYDSWIAHGQKLKRDLTSRYTLDLAHFEEIKNLGTANDYHGLVIQGMVEYYARTLEGTGGAFGTTTRQQLIDQMVAAYEALATTVKTQTIAVQGEVADLAQTSAEGVALQHKESAKKRAEARQQYWIDHAVLELGYDRSVAQSNLDAALGDITPEEKDTQIESAEDLFELATLYLDEIMISQVSLETLREARQVVSLEQGLADAVALKEKGLAESIATARYGAGGLSRTLAELDHQSTVLAANNRVEAIEWLATSSSSPLLGLTGLLSYSNTIDPMDSNATILAWMPYIHAKGVAEKVFTISLADAERTRDLSVADADLSLANESAELIYEKAVATNKNWADQVINDALSDYNGWFDAIAAELPQGFALFDNHVLDLSEVDLNLDEAVTSWSVLETRWLRTRNGSAWYEGTETSNWRSGDPRASTNNNLNHFDNRENWLGEIEGFSDEAYIAQNNASAYIAGAISDLNWEVFSEWISDAGEYVATSLQSISTLFSVEILNESCSSSHYQCVARSSSPGTSAASFALQEYETPQPDLWVALPGTPLHDKMSPGEGFEDVIVVPRNTPGAVNLSELERLAEQLELQLSAEKFLKEQNRIDISADNANWLTYLQRNLKARGSLIQDPATIGFPTNASLGYKLLAEVYHRTGFGDGILAPTMRLGANGIGTELSAMAEDLSHLPSALANFPEIWENMETYQRRDFVVQLLVLGGSSKYRKFINKAPSRIATLEAALDARTLSRAQWKELHRLRRLESTFDNLPGETLSQAGITYRMIDRIEDFAPRAGALQPRATNSGAVVYKFVPKKNYDEALSAIDSRLRNAHQIVGNEYDALIALGKLPEGSDEAIRLLQLLECSCGDAALQANRAVRGLEFAKIGKNVRQLDFDELVRLSGGRVEDAADASSLVASLGKGLTPDSPHAIVFIQPRGRNLAGHAINVELINGEIWMYEALEGIAVSLSNQPKGLWGIEPFADLLSTKGFKIIFTE